MVCEIPVLCINKTHHYNAFRTYMGILLTLNVLIHINVYQYTYVYMHHSISLPTLSYYPTLAYSLCHPVFMSILIEYQRLTSHWSIFIKFRLVLLLNRHTTIFKYSKILICKIKKCEVNRSIKSCTLQIIVVLFDSHECNYVIIKIIIRYPGQTCGAFGPIASQYFSI